MKLFRNSCTRLAAASLRRSRFAAALALLLPSFLIAQPPDRAPGSRPDRPGRVRHDGPGDRPPGPPDRRGGFDGPGGILGRLAGGPFRPAPADHGPVSTAEEGELLEFARAQMPRIGKLLDDLRDRRPEAFRQRLDESAPRLRVMRRLHQRNPELFAHFTRHVENNEQVRRMVRMVSRQDNPVRRQRIEDDLHRRVSENLDLEARILEARLRELETDRSVAVQAEVARLTSLELDLQNEPPRIARLANRFRAAADDAARETVRAEITRMVEVRLDDELDEMRTRAESLKADKPARVEQDVQRMIRRAEEAERRKAEHPDGDRPPHPEGRPPRPGDRPPPDHDPRP